VRVERRRPPTRERRAPRGHRASFTGGSQHLDLTMDQIRLYGPTGHVVATSFDGCTFRRTDDGTLFAERTDELIRMADGSLGTLIGAVVFVQNDVGEQVRAYWLESASDPTE
jgi:hypothetical protein